MAPWLIPPAADVWRERRIAIGRYYKSFGGLDKPALTTSLLLKAPGPNGEKGVLYSSFEYNWLRLVYHADAKLFFERYYLVGASSGAPPDFAAFAHLTGQSADPIFIGVSNTDQMRSFTIAAPVIQAVPLMACDWINPAYYAPKPHGERSIDILMVANWLRLKRHWLLFEALKRMRRDLRVVLIGRNTADRTEREMRAEARAFGVRQALEIFTNLDQDEVTSHQCDARISLCFSDREGSCVAPVESMFADSPVAMMRDAYVGSRAYINPETGIFVGHRGLSRALSVFHERSDSYAPRNWVMQRITCEHSSRTLNGILRAYADRAGHAWSTDIASLCWRYVPAYVHQEDEQRLRAGVDELRTRYAIELVKFAGEKKRA
jgi:glycosyltransferase involved in cell wall biosynthesis